MHLFKYLKQNQNNSTVRTAQSIEIGYCKINYIKDFCYNLSNYLINSVYEYKYLDGFNLNNYLIQENNNGEKINIDKLDLRLSQIFNLILLPKEWTLLGDSSNLNKSKINI